ncbi:hypothetical protein CDL15_Pgr029118 [Punica granatum]|uniref:Uncharacterized protein n=1 Tax=Punica granatum TaxID=22663 RepID=A0A218XKE0_PUNGR|nr:hypothetical protein CDL15_Pgr029118 [Punica granatum]
MRSEASFTSFSVIHLTRSCPISFITDLTNLTRKDPNTKWRQLIMQCKTKTAG